MAILEGDWYYVVSRMMNQMGVARNVDKSSMRKRVIPRSRIKMTRPSWDEYFLAIAEVVSQRSTCPRAHTGAVIVSPDNRILATGYNGSPPGEPHCDDVGCLMEDEHCVTGDTVLSKFLSGHYNARHKTVAELFQMERSQWKGLFDRVRIRTMDSDERIVPDRILHIWEVGVQPTFRVVTSLGRSVTTTLNQRFYTPDGWKRLDALSDRCSVALNGQNLCDNEEWLRTQYIGASRTQVSLAEEAGVNRHLIAHRLRRFGIPLREFRFGGWNRGLRADQLPYYKGRGIKNESSARGRSKYIKRECCEVCGSHYRLQVHHQDGDVRNDVPENLRVLCEPCHRLSHTPHLKTRAIRWDTIVSIESAGEQMVYDLETEVQHNFTGNGFVLHNCQRTLHAEVNAIAFAARAGVRLQGGRLYIWSSRGDVVPCRECEKVRKAAGLKLWNEKEAK